MLIVALKGAVTGFVISAMIASKGGGSIADVAEAALWGALTGAAMAVSVAGVVGSVKFLKAAAANKKIVNAVIQETLAGSGDITSTHTLTLNQAKQAGSKFAGQGSKHMAHGGGDVFVKKSGDQVFRFRMDAASMKGSHKPHIPHFHLEIFSGTTVPKNLIVNNHIPLFLR